MKRHTLTILWAIIISGSVFLITNHFKSRPAPPPPPVLTVEDPAQPVEKTTIIKENDEQATKEYSQHLKDGDKFLKEGYLIDAIKEYSAAVNKNPNSVQAHEALAQAYLENNQAQEAQEAFSTASRLNPESIELKIKIARAMLAQRKLEEAKTLIWTLPAEHPQARFYQALTMVIYKKPFEARPIFEELAKNESASEETQKFTQIFLEKYETYDNFTEESPLFLNLMLTYSLTQINEFEAAIPMLFAIIEEKNNYRDAWLILGYCYLQTEKIKDAIDALNQAKEFKDTKPETLFYLGLAYHFNNENEKALFFLEKAKTYGFTPRDVLELKLAEINEEMGLYEKAAEKYEKVIALNPNFIGPYIGAANIHMEFLQNYSKAFQIAQKAFENFPNDAKSFNLLGKAYIFLGEQEKAKDLLSTAIKIDPYYAQTYLNMGLLSEKQNLLLISKEYYRKAYALGQKSTVSKDASIGFNRINKKILDKNYQINISSP